MTKDSLNKNLRQAIIKEARCKVTSDLIRDIRMKIKQKNAEVTRLEQSNEMCDEWEKLNTPIIEQLNAEIEELFAIIDILVSEIN